MLYTIHYILYNVLSTLTTGVMVHHITWVAGDYILCTIQYIVYTTYYILYTIYYICYILYTIYCIPCNTCYTRYTIQYNVLSTSQDGGVRTIPYGWETI